MANSIIDVFAALQNGVIALGKFQRQLTGSFNNISAQLATKAPSTGVTPSSGVVTTIAGNSGAFTLNGPSGITNTVNDIKLSQGSAAQFGAVKVDNTTITAASGIISTATPLPAPLTKSTSADIALSNVTLYFDGPSLTQGTSGTWWVSGTVTLLDTAGAAQFQSKLWDGTNVIASGSDQSAGGSQPIAVSLSGFITSPASNLKISCKDVASASGKIVFNQTGNSKDSTISAMRIG